MVIMSYIVLGLKLTLLVFECTATADSLGIDRGAHREIENHVNVNRIDKNGSEERCLGEYILNEHLNECVLAANDGDDDEPTASHPHCGVGKFMCPDGGCVNTSADYAACVTGRQAYEFVPFYENQIKKRESAFTSCNLTGRWSCGGLECDIIQLSTTQFVAISIDPDSKPWHEGNATVGSDGTIYIHYDIETGNPNRTGHANPACNTISWNDNSVWTCESCEIDNLIDVHIIPHTHDDTGYLSTVDEYYESNVRSILTTVTQELQKNPERRFTYVEIAFFAKWWDEQPDDIKGEFKRLVAAGQIDFSNGGWCMPDEGAPTYQDMLSNMQKGLQYIVQEFGYDARPKVAWSIDPFGHSSTYATLNAMFGFDFFVVGRIDFQEKSARFATQSMETVWRSSRSADGASRDIMTHVLDPIQFYSYPPGFAFEADTKSWITEANIETRAQQFASFIKQKSTGYATNSLLVPFGSDFQYTNATINYMNMDLLMGYMNENQQRFGMRLQYSTPTYYMKTLHSYSKEWPLKLDDFESYAFGPDQFLVGFYSSRPDYKGFIRSTSAQLRAANVALTNAVIICNISTVNKSAEVSALDIQVSALGVAQHHDAITSSQRRHVHRDYISQLSVGQVSVDASICRTVAATVAQAGQEPKLETCPYLNESSCRVAEQATGVIVVILQNPTGHNMSGVPVRVPVSRPSTVNGRAVVLSQMVPPWPATPFVHGGEDQPPKTLHPPSMTIFFQASVPALGTSTYFIQPNAADTVPVTRNVVNYPITMENGILNVKFGDDGLLQSMTKGDVTVNVKQSLQYYVGGTGADSPYANQGATGSGNYIFQPHSPKTNLFTPSGAPVNVSVVQGPFVSEVRHIFVADSIEQVFRLYNGSNTLEIEYRIGPIEVADGIGKEVISRFDTDILNGNEFATDVNGMQINTRTKDTRSTLWPGGPHYFNQTDPVSGNYFAVNTLAKISDSAPKNNIRRQFSVLVDRSEGCTSLTSGQLELMLHRRLTHGCRWGMCENGETVGLNDTLGAEVVIKHRISIDSVNADGASDAEIRGEIRKLNYPPSLLLGTARSEASWTHKMETSPLSNELPSNLELTTWQVTEDGSIILRLTHMYPKGEHITLSQPVTIDICTIFGASLCARMMATSSGSFVEMTAAGDVPLDSVERLTWRVQGEDTKSNVDEMKQSVPQPGLSMPLTILPADTRTFKVTL